MKIHEWAIFNNADDYADCDMVIDTGTGEWRFVLSLDKETGGILTPDHVDFAADPADAWEDTSMAAVPSEVLRLYEERRPYGIALLHLTNKGKE